MINTVTDNNWAIPVGETYCAIYYHYDYCNQFGRMNKNCLVPISYRPYETDYMSGYLNFNESLYKVCDFLMRLIMFQPPEKAKYDQIFQGLQPVNGLLSGDKVRPVSTSQLLCFDIFLVYVIHNATVTVIMKFVCPMGKVVTKEARRPSENIECRFEGTHNL